MNILKLRNRRAKGPGDRDAAIPIETARVCSVCWTVHQADECPECKARQWRPLLDILQVLGLEPWTGNETWEESRAPEADTKAS
ncbi:MAG: hypothetical protein AB1916_15745 [Thermodesulfobacteriota bacterium]